MVEFLAQYWSFGIVIASITISWLFGVYILGNHKIWFFDNGLKAHLKGDLEPFLYLLVLSSTIITTLHAGAVFDFLINGEDSIVGEITQNWNIWRTFVCLHFSASNYVIYKTLQQRASESYDKENLVHNIWGKIK